MVNQKKLLVVSYFFPPASIIGAVRITKFVKYLLRFGWDITVLTVKEEYYDNYDFESLKDVQGAKIIRTKVIKPIKCLRERGLYWLPYLNIELKKLLSKERFDISLWTGNPFYHWILAPKFKREYGLFYVLDFRDEWSLSKVVKKWYGTKFFKLKRFIDVKISEIIEPKIVNQASAIINVTDELTELYKNRYKDLVPENNFYTIYNGFDLEDLPKKKSKKCYYFKIVYAGRFAKFRFPFAFFEALNNFINERKLKPEEIKFIWVGEKEKDVIEFLDKINLNEYVVFIEHRPYKEVLELIENADVGLLIVGHFTEASTKLFDYIALKKTILLISDEGARAVKIAREYGNAKIVKNNINEIKDAIAELFDKRFLGKINEKVLEFYNREYQAKKLEYIMNKIIENNKGY
jgi:hypothetical protein